MSGPNRPNQGCLMYTLVGGVGAIFLVTMVMVTGGWFAYILLAMGLFASFVTFHYFLWGHLAEMSTPEEDGEDE